MLNRNDDTNEVKNMVLFCVAAASAVLLLFLIVLYFHEGKEKTGNTAINEEISENDDLVVEHDRPKVTSQELDIWDDYEKEKIPEDEDRYDAGSSSEKKQKKKSDDISKHKDDSSSELSEEEQKKDEKDDGKHIKAVGPDGETDWYEIDANIGRNDFDFESNLSNENGLMKYSGAGVRSYSGINLTSYCGSVDFAKVKDAGIDFVMLRVASRGYDSGQVSIDNRFVEYVQGAASAGIPVGMYFTSQAVTDVEAVEEANYAIAAGMNYNVRFPVAIDIQNVAGARTEKLTPEERTQIIKKFCETVKSYGKIPVICASRDFLIANIELSELSDYEIWLKDKAVTADTSDGASYIGTDYPYKFSMWNYSENGTVNGVNGAVELNMSFVNYAER